MSHDPNRDRIFWHGVVWEEMVRVYCSGTLMFANFYGDTDLERRYGEGVMTMSVKKFQTYTVINTDDVKYRDRMSDRTGVVPAQLYAL